MIPSTRTRRRSTSTGSGHYGAEPLPNELICARRDEGRPPHVLVTNFAMLEYLLLRPDEQTFFDGDDRRALALRRAR